MTAPSYALATQDMTWMELEKHARSLRETCKAQDAAAQKVTKALLSAGIMNQRVKEALVKHEFPIPGEDEATPAYCTCGGQSIDGHMSGCVIMEALALKTEYAEKQAEALLEFFRAADDIGETDETWTRFYAALKACREAGVK